MKNFIIAIATISVLIVFSSCEANTPENDSRLMNPYVRLEQELYAYGDSFIDQSQTRISIWKRLGNIFMCDGIGAATGSLLGPEGTLFGAIVGSTSRLIVEIVDHGLDSQMPQNLEILYNNSAQLYDDPNYIDAADSTGIMHNIIISEILEENPNIVSLSENELNKIISNKISKYTVSPISFTIDEFKSFSQLSKSESSDQLFGYSLLEYPVLEKELRIVKIYADNIANIEDNDIPEFSRGFKEIIEDSEIEESSKTVVTSAISVTGSSKLMWNEEAFKDVQ